jgi:hypothetical protein
MMALAACPERLSNLCTNENTLSDQVFGVNKWRGGRQVCLRG